MSSGDFECFDQCTWNNKYENAESTQMETFFLLDFHWFVHNFCIFNVAHCDSNSCACKKKTNDRTKNFSVHQSNGMETVIHRRHIECACIHDFSRVWTKRRAFRTCIILMISCVSAPKSLPFPAKTPVGNAIPFTMALCALCQFTVYLKCFSSSPPSPSSTSFLSSFRTKNARMIPSKIGVGGAG